MTKDIEVVGLESLAHVSRALKAAGTQGKGLRKELNRSITRETKQTRNEMRQAIMTGLPVGGGLAANVQSTTRFTSTTSSTGVRIRVRGKRSIRRMNATGSFRHPVFGNRDVWVTQSAGVERGFLDRPFEQARPQLQRAVVTAIGRIRAQIYRSI